MWGSVGVLALLAALDPVRLGLTLLVISRPRPVQNLLAFGVGSLAGCIHTLVVPLTLLHVTPMFTAVAQGLAHPATSPTVRHVQIGMGVLALSISALIAMRALARRPAQPPTPVGNTSTLVRDSDTAAAMSRLLGGTQDAAAQGGSAIRRLLGRAHTAWESGSLWVAFVLGVAMGGPPLDGLPFLLAIIAGSGAAVGTQVIAATVFVAGTLAVVEIVLVSYLTTPAKTQAVLRQLHEWALAHRLQVLVAIFAVVGVSLVARGMSTA